MTAHPSIEERARWSAFLAEALRHAQALIDWHAEAALLGRPPSDPIPDATRLLKLRRALRLTPLPENQQFVGSTLHRLCRLVEAWGDMALDQRGDRQAELKELAGRAIDETEPKRRGDVVE